MNPIAVGSDHGGLRLKATLLKTLQGWGFETQDLGCHSSESCDYPDFAHALASGIEQGLFELGLLVCGTGVGMSIAANRHPAVRAAVVSDPFTARMAREHNHANVLCLGERVVGEGLAVAIVRAWLDARPDTDPRHSRRVEKLNASGPKT
jgi:ribose 5-phosphate isomerase B